MREESRLRAAFAFFRPILSPFVSLKFNYKYDVIAPQEKPFLILCNHNMNVDPILLGMATRQPLRFVASEHIMRKGFGTWFLNRYFQPIIHTKGKTGLKSSMDIVRAIHKGNSVALFPEGNRSFNGLTGDIPDVTGKLAKMCGGGLITYRIEGGYLSQPRWSLSLRRGKLHGKLIRIYSKEDLRAMSDTQVTELIRQDLFEDAFATQKNSPVAFKGKDIAKGMESTLYLCPKCKKIGHLTTDSTHIRCSCGFSSEYTPYGELTGTEHTIATWDQWQKSELRQIVAASATEDTLFSDEVLVQQINDAHAIVDEKRCTLHAHANGCYLNDSFIPIADIIGAAVHSRNVLTVHHAAENRHYEIFGTESFCALKYLDLYKLLTM